MATRSEESVGLRYEADGREVFCSNGMFMGAHADERTAAAVAARLTRIYDRDRSMFATRAEYEARSAEAGFAALADADIPFALAAAPAGGYDLTNDPTGDLALAEYLASARQRGMARERALADAKPRPAPAPVACPNCGRRTDRSHLMHASLGTACPECYDDLADA